MSVTVLLWVYLVTRKAYFYLNEGVTGSDKITKIDETYAANIGGDVHF